ncbi:MAG TPA: serine protease [Gemmatimonadales bacterium]|nr:serine protease [Gemmatimonadales bacterium]
MRRIALGLLLLVAAAPAAMAQDADTLPAPTGVAAQLFRRYADRVAKVEVLEVGSGAKALTGSAFFVSGDGLLITNYHVVARLVRDPDSYQVQLIDHTGATRTADVLVVDVVHDLAVLETDPRPGDPYFTFAADSLDQGQRLYALGHPLELGLAIVEGTYNGLLRHSLYPRIHFTGALNPGMSGGPTIDAAGRVVGINVSTAGNEVSFLVPGTRAAELVAEVEAPGYRAPDDLAAEVARQLRVYQRTYLSTLFTRTVPVTQLGGATLPTDPAPYFNCWADADNDPDAPYQSVVHRCSTDDEVFLAEDHWSGVIEFQHRVLTADGMPAAQFYRIYQDAFAEGTDALDDGGDDVTDFRCTTRNVRQGGARWRTAFCVRAYTQLEGLYDAVFRAALLGRADTGVITELTLSGVTYDNAVAVSRRFFGLVKWKP